MPKQVYKIDQFHGGLNTNADPRDIAENELSEAQDVMVDELGRIRMMGGAPAHGTTNAFGSTTINPGYGLFQFSHDRHGAEQKVEHSGTYTDGGVEGGTWNNDGSHSVGYVCPTDYASAPGVFDGVCDCFGNCICQIDAYGTCSLGTLQDTCTCNGDLLSGRPCGDGKHCDCDGNCTIIPPDSPTCCEIQYYCSELAWGGGCD